MKRHEAREQRNREILAMHERGCSTGEICEKIGVSYSALTCVLLSSGVSRHARRSEDRKKAAALVADGGDLKTIAVQFHCGLGWVEDACREHGVKRPLVKRGRPPGRVLLVIADLQNNPDDTFQVIADRHSMTRARAHQILVEAIACGVLFPGRRVPAVKPQPADTETNR